MNNFELLVEHLILERLLKITGPALYYKPAKVLVRGKIGTGHMMLWDRLYPAMAKKMNISVPQAESLVDANPQDVLDGFMTSEGKFVDRERAWNIAKKYKEQIKQYDQQIKSFGGTGELASEYL